MYKGIVGRTVGIAKSIFSIENYTINLGRKTAWLASLYFLSQAMKENGWHGRVEELPHPFALGAYHGIKFTKGKESLETNLAPNEILIKKIKLHGKTTDEKVLIDIEQKIQKTLQQTDDNFQYPEEFLISVYGRPQEKFNSFLL